MNAPEPLHHVDFLTVTEEEWRKRLTPEEFAVLRQGGTEAPGTGAYTTTMEPGTYHCVACDAELFSSNAKFLAHCGWPAFFAPTHAASVTCHPDNSLGRQRTEVRCATCGSHLGHVFAGEGYETPTDLRFCINSVCLKHRPPYPENGH